MEFILIKGHAGSGKSILMQRLAWEAAKEYDKVCLYLKPNGKIRIGPLQELLELLKEPVFLFVDGITSRIGEISRLANSIGPNGKYLTIIAAERINEWNIDCSDIYDLVTCEHELRYLSKKEIVELLQLLKLNNSLGVLENATEEEKINAFEKKAGRQLLVALHEATFGRPFEDIIENEFNNIKPEEAKHLYLSICTLNRLDIAVRAGIISRLHGIRIADFKDRFFKPLETIVYTKYCEITRDYVYQARHPHIAEIVFNRVFKNQEHKYDYYLKCLSLLNIDYQSDRKAFREMVHAKTLLDMFQNVDLIFNIYRTALDIAPEEPLLWHQQAIFEMTRDNGNLTKAAEYLNKAIPKMRDPHMLIHSLAELELKRSENAKTELEKETFLGEAEKVAYGLINKYSWDAYGYHTVLKANIEKLKIQLSKTEPDAILIEKLVLKIEKELDEGLQRFPDNHYILKSDAELGHLLKDSKRAVSSLEKAFELNPRNSLIALRLYRFYLDENENDKAEKILESAINHNPNEKKLHFRYALHLINKGNENHDLLEYHLKRSYSPGDKNYTAQILYGRELYLNNRFDECESHFKPLRELRVGTDLRNILRFVLPGEFTGEISTLSGNYCFLVRDGSRDSIFGHRMNSDLDGWLKLTIGKHVKFRIGFTIRGPQAFEIEAIKNY